MEQLSLYDLLYEKYKITKPIRLIELFSGYGSQALALKYLGVDFTHWRICEWATKSIQAYNDLHIRDYTDYSKDLTTDAVIERLAAYGISMDYNKPMTLDQIKRKGVKWIRNTYNNIIATHNLVDVSKAKATNLNITDTEKFTYLLTYSFPCQDLSSVGLGKGMSRNSGTRSGLLWQVERILNECEELPQVLLMENVPEIISQKNINDFRAWQLYLEKKGYSNFCEILNAKDYFLPQNRDRCYMVSILGNYNFKMPRANNLKYFLKDFVKLGADKRYYLAESVLRTFTYFSGDKKSKKFKDLRGLRFNPQNIKTAKIANCITTRACTDVVNNTYIIETPNLHYDNDKACFYIKNGNQKKYIDTFNNDIEIKIRKNTPKEAWALMGVKNTDFTYVAKAQSISSQYHLAGDSIVTTVLMAIFGELLGIDYQSKITELVEELKECA